MDYQKLERDGLVAVIVSPGYGAGWSTWADGKDQQKYMFDSRVAQAILGNSLTPVKMKEWGYGDYEQDSHRLSQLQVVWVPKGSAVKIDCYDGNESYTVIRNPEWITV